MLDTKDEDVMVEDVMVEDVMAEDVMAIAMLLIKNNKECRRIMNNYLLDLHRIEKNEKRGIKSPKNDEWIKKYVR